MKKGIIIFQKNAELGKVKTRLAATIGDEAAFDAYQKLVRYTHKVTSQSPAQKILFFSNYLEENTSKYPLDYRFELQSGEGLGEKMSRAFQKLFVENFDHLVIIGTDCAEISPEIISKAFDELEKNEVVIGPAKDGGYYLLGMREYIPGIFENIPWSTAQVVSKTKEYLTSNNFSFSTLQVLSDVDLLEDWLKFKGKLGNM